MTLLPDPSQGLEMGVRVRGESQATLSFLSAYTAGGGASVYRDGVEGSAGPWGEIRAADSSSGVTDMYEQQ